ncbi:PIG-L family deacetylase [Massilia soli]|uniref:PIG-L family deacetylase n=1 Tax=Massilia soli TaxID=2792854 RepID=A0ABS7SMT8_9BURK|nr:PIG-L family deacetylase [Massilia soli]MBZ2207487.1 PIG-L family deacetylase [Massilia soli]
MKHLIRACAIAGLALLSQPAAAAVFFAAHPDDVVLFMGQNAFRDIRGGHPTVIVILTAGDAGNAALPNALGTEGNFDHNQQGKPYYRVRHDAHNAALAYWVSAGAPPAAVKTAERFSAQIPAVEKTLIGNVIVYNLNLPDGKLSQLLPGGVATALADITGRNRYTGATLKETVRQIVVRHHRGRRLVIVNLPEHDPGFAEMGYNERLMPDEHGNLLKKTRIDLLHPDHPDHTAVGRFVITALGEQPAMRCVYRAVYLGYAVQNLPAVMTPFELFSQEIAVFHRMNGVLIHQGNVIRQLGANQPLAGQDDPFHRSFLGKQQWRDAGGGSVCAFP